MFNEKYDFTTPGGVKYEYEEIHYSLMDDLARVIESNGDQTDEFDFLYPSFARPKIWVLDDERVAIVGGHYMTIFKDTEQFKIWLIVSEAIDEYLNKTSKLESSYTILGTDIIGCRN